MLITEMPDNAVPITSGLFQAKPQHVIVLPVLFEGQVKAVIELASLGGFTDLQLTFLEQLTDVHRHRAQHASRRRCRPRVC